MGVMGAKDQVTLLGVGKYESIDTLVESRHKTL